jgi:hypothetical protein
MYYTIISIHPFEDGNGRIGALLANIECFRHEFTFLDMLHIRAIDTTFIYYIVDMCESGNCEVPILQKALQAIDNFHKKTSGVISPFGPQVDEYWKNRHLFFSKFDD